MSTHRDRSEPGTVRIERDGAIAHVVLSNPARYNAMSLAMWRGLADALDTLGADAAVRVIALRGDGERAFVSGADISEFGEQRNDPRGVALYDEAVARAQRTLADTPKPTLACIRGVCMGGGIGLALACDLRIAAADTRFRMPAARLGLGYALAGMERVVGQIGAAAATELFYLARTFDGAEALRMGLVHRAYAPDRFDDECARYLADIAGNAPLTLHAAKLAIREAQRPPDERDEAAVDRAVRACFDSNDYREGRAAFAEKRPPRFTGH
ncbi:short chain enoyl-CoA hydratase [Caballeronia cordobensis]|uniref:Short chain enoyl-CoA hydratase n=1 Tax=Caballeronia cordobensis TaxID=1353886 RepID=A0A158HK25_CABCO|nr:enoyl-CoA hydratase [Caballeronia cordobensis]SAL44311.1 short chain enoyl-CoA hydratase [Caballeronia cordobensis]